MRCRTGVAIDKRKALVVTGKTGAAKQVITQCELSVDDKTLTDTRSRMGIIVAAKGYGRLCARVGGLTVPDRSVVIGNRELPNGSTDPDTGDLYCRAMCAAYTDLGLLFLTTRTIVYNAQKKIVQDYACKAKEHPRLCKLWPNGLDTEGPSWVRYPVNDRLDVVFDTSKPEVIKWVIDEMRTEEFAVRKAQTMADRNAQKAHPIIVVPNEGNLSRHEVVDCTCWYTPEGPLRIDGSVWKVDVPAMLTASAAEVDDSVIDVEAITAEDEAAAKDPAAEAEDGAEPIEESEVLPIEDNEEKAKEISAEDHAKALGAVLEAGKAKPGAYVQILREVGVEKTKVHTADTAMLRKIVKMLEAA